MTLVASVYFVKEIEMDNYEKGAYGNRLLVHDEKFKIEFTDTDDLKDGLGEWLSNNFDVDKDVFVKYVENEFENNRFDYSQNEDGEGCRIKITEDNPDGWIADYFFYVDVLQKVDYAF